MSLVKEVKKAVARYEARQKEITEQLPNLIRQAVKEELPKILKENGFKEI